MQKVISTYQFNTAVKAQKVNYIPEYTITIQYIRKKNA